MIDSIYKIFPNLSASPLNRKQIWIVIILFPNFPNQSKKFNYNQNFVYINKIQKRFRSISDSIYYGKKIYSPLLLSSNKLPCLILFATIQKKTYSPLLLCANKLMHLIRFATAKISHISYNRDATFHSSMTSDVEM